MSRRDLPSKFLFKKANNQSALTLQNSCLHSSLYSETSLNNNHLEIAVPVPVPVPVPVRRLDKSPIVIKQPPSPTSVKVDMIVIQPHIKCKQHAYGGASLPSPSPSPIAETTVLENQLPNKNRLPPKIPLLEEEEKKIPGQTNQKEQFVNNNWL